MDGKIYWNDRRPVLKPVPVPKTRRKTGTSFGRLADRIRDDLGIEVDRDSLKRTYAGYWQRKAGAWSWEGRTLDGHRIGSAWTAGELLKSRKLTTVDGVNWHTETEIAPDD